ncbi:MAG: response regulator [Cyanobacteria bacterium P01_G01_bin.39]
MISTSPQNSLISLDKDNLSILIIDDDKLVSQVLTSALEPEPDLKIVGSIREAQTALEQMSIFSPDIVLMDVEMPGIDGLTLTAMITNKDPDIKVVIYSSHGEPEHICQAIEAGARGYLLKDTPIAEIADAIRSVNKGYIQFRIGLFKKIFSTGQFMDQNHGSSAPSISPSFIEQDILALPPGKDVAENNCAVSKTEKESSEISETGVDDWSPSTTDLLDALPKVWTRGLAYMLVIFAAILIPVASMSRIDETGSARGRLEPKGKTIKLDAAVAGKVAAVKVKEGDTVEVGDVLVELDAELMNNQLQELQEKQSGQQNRLEQLELMKNQLAISLLTQKQQNQAQELEKQSQVEQARQSLNSFKALHNVQKEEIAAQVEQAKQAVESSQADHKLASIALNGIGEKVSRYQQAFDDGIIPLDRLRDIEQQAQENQERLLQANSQVQQAKSRLREQQRSYERIIQEKEFEIENAQLYLQEQQRSYQTLVHSGKLALLKTDEQIKDLEAQMTTLQAEIAQSNSQIASLQLQLEQRILKAPIAGRVFHLSVLGVGDVLQPGEKMVEIAPDTSPLVLRAQISPKESGSLKLGMPVKMKFDAYPFQDYGIVTGRLTWIAPDSKYLEMNQSLQEVFELEIELDQTYVEGQNQRLLLTPGQTATAEVIVKQRRVIELVLEPFKKLQKNGLEL